MHTLMEHEPNWEWYRTFLHVLESGSLSAAARSMGLTQPTVGRHVDNLENALGLKLFIRSFDGFAATDAAIELRPYAASVAATTAAIRRVASSHGDGVRGSVRITASEVVGVEVLPPILASLRNKHPKLVIELVLSNAVGNLLHREADIAIRMLEPTQDALISKRIGAIGLGLHAHKRYLSKHGTPASMDALAGHAIIGFDTENSFTRKIQERMPALARQDFAFRADSHLAHLAAIRAGLGIGICQSALARRDKNLVRVLPKACAFAMETYLAMHEDLRESPRCSAVFAALSVGLTAYVNEA